jgi:hypothetical protein
MKVMVETLALATRHGRQIMKWGYPFEVVHYSPHFIKYINYIQDKKMDASGVDDTAKVIQTYSTSSS